MSKKTSISQVIVPHILILEDEEKHENVSIEILSHLMHESVASLTDSDESFGFYALDSEDESESFELGWYSSLFELKSTLLSGKPQKKDSHRVNELSIRQLLDLSLKFTIDESDENMLSYNEGSFEISIGDNEHNRTYLITYKNIEDNLHLMMEDLESTFNILQNELFQQTPDKNTTIH